MNHNLVHCHLIASHPGRPTASEAGVDRVEHRGCVVVWTAVIAGRDAVHRTEIYALRAGDTTTQHNQ